MGTDLPQPHRPARRLRTCHRTAGSTSALANDLFQQHLVIADYRFERHLEYLITAAEDSVFSRIAL